MIYTRKRRSALLAAAGVALGLLLGLPGGASASCDPPTPPPDANMGHDPAGLKVATNCMGSANGLPIAAIGRRH